MKQLSRAVAPTSGTSAPTFSTLAYTRTTVLRPAGARILVRAAARKDEDVHYKHVGDQSGPLRVAVDPRHLWALGIGTYVRNLLGGLARAGGPELALTLLLPPGPWRDTWTDPVAARAGFPGAGPPAGGGPHPAPPAAGPAVRILEIATPKQSVREQVENNKYGERPG